ncbi:P-loop containing nucleoside triphosphate hydrolase protein [Paraphysoderma sedebokerense]|nr:P-loop containing nucleoside triphosphate hydrolase protein [Paraphysoderma sedebokerense]
MWIVKDISESAKSEKPQSAATSKNLKRSKNQKSKKRLNPASQSSDSQPSKKTKFNPKPKSKKPNLPKSISNENKSIDDLKVDDIDSWGWNQIDCPDGIFSSAAPDDFGGGFICLEEIDGVDVEYVGGSNEGKLIKFKKSGNGKAKSKKQAKPATPYEPLPIEQFKDFVHVDSILEDDDPSVINRAIKQSKVDESDDISADDVSGFENTEDEESDYNENEVDIDDLEDIDVDNENQESQLANDMPGVQEENDSEEKSSVVPNFVQERPSISLPNVSDFPEVSAWVDLLPKIHPLLLKAIHELKFEKPTNIQSKSLPESVINGRDIVGAAETGSGKTLAFGLPILQHLTEAPILSPRRLTALILSPTRELALQINKHLECLASPFSHSHSLNRIHIVPLVGGLSEFKQTRLLSGNVDIIVATPGRLWEMIESGTVKREWLKDLRFLVLDEADSMLQNGKFKELEAILSCVSLNRKDTYEWDDKFSVFDQQRHVKAKVRRQTFIFSATLPAAISPNDRSRKKIKNSLQALFRRIEFADPTGSPLIVDVTSQSKVASQLVESRIDCMAEEKDVYLYYLLLRYPGRTLVFVNSISSLRRLLPIFSNLNLPVYGLHAQMQQRQRLKNLDRFANSDTCILIASDVASRGLDVRNVQHVIHYQVPKTKEGYVHRSGRTARANQEGISIMLVSPPEVTAYKKICYGLGKLDGLDEFPVERGYNSELKKRLKLAQEIDQEQHQTQKSTFENNWLSQTAEALDIDIDPDFLDASTLAKLNSTSSKSQEKATKARVNQLKDELNQLLKKPVVPKGLSMKYLTNNIKEGLVSVINEGKNTVMATEGNIDAIDEVRQKKKGKKSN